MGAYIREKKKEYNVKEREREGSTQGEGGVYKKLRIPTLPPKLRMSGITFHCFQKQPR